MSDPIDPLDIRRKAKQELLLLTDALVKRRESDPLRNFEPHAKQKEFIQSVLRGECTENWFLAANRSGKSDAGAYCGATLARFGLPEDEVRETRGKGSNITVRDRATSGWVSGLDFPTLRDSLQPKYFDNGHVPPGQTHAPFIPEHEIVDNGWNKTDQVLRLRNGSIITFKSADSGASKYQAAERDWIHIDEQHPKPIWEEITLRIGAGKLRLFTTATLLPPEGVVGGVTWIYPDIVKPWKIGRRPFAKIFTAAIYDNPHIPREEIAKLEAMYVEGTPQRRIRLNGELLPNLAGALAYSAFAPGVHIKQQPPLNPRRPLLWTWDFNVAPLCSLVCQQYRDEIRVYREIVMDEGSIPEMVDLFRMLYPSHLAEVVVLGDASGRARSHQSREADYTLIQNCMLSYNAPVRVNVPWQNPPIRSRINAVNLALKDEHGYVSLTVDGSCHELISDLEGVILDPVGAIKKTTNPKDPYKRRTHTSDALGYLICQLKPVTILRGDNIQGQQFQIPRPGYTFGLT